MCRLHVIAILPTDCTLLTGARGRWLLPYGFPAGDHAKLKMQLHMYLLSLRCPRSGRIDIVAGFRTASGWFQPAPTVTVTVHKIIVSNDPDDELWSTRDMMASMH